MDGINAIIKNKNILRIITESHVETILNNATTSGKVCIIKDVFNDLDIYVLLGIADMFIYQKENQL